MQKGPKEIVYFELSEGRYPFREWREELKDAVARNKIDARLMRLELGNPGDWRSVGAGVFELKIDLGPGYRLYGAEDGPVLVILLAGGTKASQRRDIAVAKDYWAMYLDKKGRNLHA